MAYILKLKFDFGWGSATDPTGGAYRSLGCISGPYVSRKRRGGEVI